MSQSKSRVTTPRSALRLTPKVVPAIVPLDDVQRRIVVAAEEARRVAEDANRAKLDWLRAMSHELRTPLNAIGGFVQLLKSGARGELSDKVLSDLDRIERNQKHMASLIDDVLHIARLEAGRVQFDMATIPVSRLLLDLHDYVPLDAKAKGRSIVVHRDVEDVLVRADEDKARQILINLIANALKHTPVTASIEVFVGDHDARSAFHAICVRDTGPGIPADRLQSVFEPFFQVGNQLTRSADGLGLGLAIARELARGMGGDLRVESAAGQGSTFILLLQGEQDRRA